MGLGAFLVACLGLLAEYSLPLITRAEILSPGRQRKVLGIVMSALALLASLAPLLLVRAPQPPAPPAQLLERPRAELLSAPVSLSPDNPELELVPPNWLTGVQRLFVVSMLTNGVQVPQGEAVAQLVATDDQDIPHFFNLRAGVDTAEWALDKREVAAQAQHGSARLAQSWLVYSPTGEAFSARTYFSGLFLGGDIYRLREVRLRYLYRNPPGRPPLTLEVKRIFIN